MRCTLRCPHCERTQTAIVAAEEEAVRCAACAKSIRLAPRGDAEGLPRCRLCGSEDLFVRKAFPQRLGLLIVVVGFVASSVAWYQAQVAWTFAILFAMALVDLLLYLWMGSALVCYRCEAEYRDLDGIERHGPFDLETHERYRQMAARQRQAARLPSP